jgi:hypothetical protein
MKVLSIKGIESEVKVNEDIRIGPWVGKVVVITPWFFVMANIRDSRKTKPSILGEIKLSK